MKRLWICGWTVLPVVLVFATLSAGEIPSGLTLQELGETMDKKVASAFASDNHTDTERVESLQWLAEFLTRLNTGEPGKQRQLVKNQLLEVVLDKVSHNWDVRNPSRIGSLKMKKLFYQFVYHNTDNNDLKRSAEKLYADLLETERKAVLPKPVR